ncbi:Protein lsb5 [Termitomyces sp. T112]|nr:Protein lsb5 [Termitomyces sp. T112]
MSAFHFAKQAFVREKPRSSITDWVDILTSSSIDEETYDGIPELVDSINLQAAGPAEVSRAIRKKLKHGNAHQQYRALVLLKALVENCGAKFTSSFADGHLTDAIKNLSADHTVDKKVRKKLIAVLASWQEQFKSDSSMSAVAGLYKQCIREGRYQTYRDVAHPVGTEDNMKEQGNTTKAEEERQQRSRQNVGNQFVFEKDKPKVLASIVEASQASSNLMNAITLFNSKADDIRTNQRVQECLEKARQARKPVIRYIQLVENEELIGTLIETNERIMAALEKYDNIVAGKSSETTNALAGDLASAHITSDSVAEEQHNPRDPQGQSVTHKSDINVHPDLRDLDFGPLGASSNNLPRPLQPSTLSDEDEAPKSNDRGSLSDFSDYSSDEETHASGMSSRKQGGKDYANMDDEPYESRTPLTKQVTGDDPFADPFADEVTVGPSKRW